MMNIDLPTVAKIICFLLFFTGGLWSTTDILQSKKPWSERVFEAFAMILAWALMGILVIYFAKFILFFIAAFLVISLVLWFIDKFC